MFKISKKSNVLGENIAFLAKKDERDKRPCFSFSQFRSSVVGLKMDDIFRKLASFFLFSCSFFCAIAHFRVTIFSVNSMRSKICPNCQSKLMGTNNKTLDRYPDMSKGKNFFSFQPADHIPLSFGEKGHYVLFFWLQRFDYTPLFFAGKGHHVFFFFL